MLTPPANHVILQLNQSLQNMLYSPGNNVLYIRYLRIRTLLPTNTSFSVSSVPNMFHHMEIIPRPFESILPIT